ncbi:Uncharacterised protein (plasmid) [Tsukamurella tyrosinosolvens]|uniref:Uncharacterized protein n=1 Tax=Tsukamurella tyrosinosolvens TaxID=57704 RepID=A0A1H4VK53_TSUTY|nr:hypothetical protein [Tsukamurella tyrosinosolvens]KXO90951.1 hypothetical protein AXK58_21190 [Tsukamurella tyrosinosolvens]SEC81512.1 hypothetical protein SAMN04489793_3258 [Tsukamurella tyrosinosolvens]VEH90457.1 Uncharacterised protein [Tsukamurella tyrosinosolvens]
MNTWPGRGGWHTEMQGDVEWHIATVAGGHRAAGVTRNDAGEWVAQLYERDGWDVEVVGSGYPSLHEAMMAADDARNR